MDEEFKKEWVAALRSGKYPQTTNALTRIDLQGNVVGHCCLGVACEIAVEKGILEPVDGKEITVSGTIRGYRGRSDRIAAFATLPATLIEAVGMEDFHGIINIPSKGDDPTTSLPIINDSGESFDHIADLIEYFG